MPGVVATVIGENLRQGDPYTAHFVTGDGKRIDAPIQWLSLTAFRVIVPNIETGPSVPDVPQNANRFYVHRGTLPSNALPFQAVPAPALGTGPAPVLDGTDRQPSFR